MIYPKEVDLPITHVHITNGVRRSICWCLIAYAAEKAFGFRAKVSSSSITLYSHDLKKILKVYSLDSKGTEFIACFDSGMTMCPTTIHLIEVKA